MVQNRTFLMRIGQQPGGPGRAKVYDPDIHPALVMQLAQEGMFPEEWASEIGVTFMTFRNWYRDHPEFAEAFEAARLLLETHWTRELKKNLNNPGARPGLWGLMMRRFSHYYGTKAPDLWAWFRDEQAKTAAPAPDGRIDNPATAATADIERRLAELRARQEAAKEE